jgi:hypothetical protein
MRRITVRLDDGLLERAKSEASRRGGSVTALIEQGLTLVLAQSKRSRPRRRVALSVSRARGGTLAGVDLSDSATLLDIMDGRR